MEWQTLLCSDRIRKQKQHGTQDFRTPFEQDYHRIINSPSFRRLQDKTQVFTLDQSDFVRTRLTHSLEVSAIAKSLGQSVSVCILKEGKDPGFRPEYQAQVCDILQCAGLIHDIGNPPFGHFGETVIREWFLKHLDVLEMNGTKLSEILNEQMCRDFLCFEGNNQAFRLVTKLHFLTETPGMNLTKALLSTIMKYPVSSLEIDPDSGDVRTKKTGYFYADRENFALVQEACGTGGARHPLCFILEAADDIAYRTADIEDGYRKGLISYEQLLRELKKRIDPEDDGQALLVRKLEKRYSKGAGRGVTNPEEYAVRNWMVLLQGVAIEQAAAQFGKEYDSIMSGNYPYELLAGTPAGAIVNILGDIAVEYIFHSELIYKREISEEVILNFLLDKFVDAAIYYDTDRPLKPVQVKLMSLISENYITVYRMYSVGKDEAEKLYLRLLLVTDYICGMTDNYAKSLYHSLNGINPIN